MCLRFKSIEKFSMYYCHKLEGLGAGYMLRRLLSVELKCYASLSTALQLPRKCWERHVPLLFVSFFLYLCRSVYKKSTHLVFLHE